LLIDFNDSFTHILGQYVSKSCNSLQVTIKNIEHLLPKEVSRYDKVIFGPGPGVPEDYPTAFEILDTYKGKKCFLGICMGHQIISLFAGASLYNLGNVSHGQRVKIMHNGNSILFKDVPREIHGGLYHSWAVKPENDAGIVTTSVSEDGVIMSVENSRYCMYGIQFHPESYMTEYGLQILRNWLVEN